MGAFPEGSKRIQNENLSDPAALIHKSDSLRNLFLLMFRDRPGVAACGATSPTPPSARDEKLLVPTGEHQDEGHRFTAEASQAEALPATDASF